MELHRAIIHELVKQPAKDGNPEVKAHYVEAEGLLDSTNELTIKLIESIQSLYGTKGNASAQGTFDRSGAYVFPERFNDFIDSAGEDDDFFNLTLDAMKSLVKEAKDENFATGGYIVFAFYTQNAEEFLLGAMVKKRDGIRLKNLVPETVQEVDLSKLHQAIKVNLSRYLHVLEAEEAQEEGAHSAYLSFISPKANQDASGYFISAFGCSDAIPARTLTENAILAVRNFFERSDDLNFLAVDAKDEVVDYLDATIKDKAKNKTCALDDLNHLVNSMLPVEHAEKYRDTFVPFANEEPYCLPERFITNALVVRRAKKVNVRGMKGMWSLNVEKRILGTTVNHDVQFVEQGENSYLTIRNLSENIIQKLNAALADE
ncbi:nucleoid-associated protein [Alteromonas sp. P256]|uniref:nucleoid-associated protein n=1 Tax=Alteromonas sp. P256 TaxID=3117399 RepID=UPI002FDFD545